MLLYRISEETKIFNQSGDYHYMINLVMDDYKNYFKASSSLKCRYDFCIQAIYSCLSRINNLENKSDAYKELHKFLEEIRKENGLDMLIVYKDRFYVREKPKVKIKRYRRAI